MTIINTLLGGEDRESGNPVTSSDLNDTFTQIATLVDAGNQ